MKPCCICKECKPLNEFYRASSSKDGRQSECIPCNKTLRRNRWIKSFYSWSAELFAEMLTKQGGVCAICRQKCKEECNLSIDHDHACCPGQKKSCGKCIRGLLCKRCNALLGLAKDDPVILRLAIEYIERKPAVQ